MKIRLSKSFQFEAAHWLPTFPEGHKCRRMHGHSFRIDIVVAGEVDQEKGYLIDYGTIKQAAQPVIDRLDHYVLNEIEGLENPTAEMIAKWVFDHVSQHLPMLTAVRVHETCTTQAEYRG